METSQQRDLQPTADLSDEYGEQLQILNTPFRSFGAVRRFGGPIETVRIFEDNVLFKRMLETPGNERVLVVDAGGSHRCAVMGDNVATLAVENGWAGVLIHGCVRDSAELGSIELGIRALGTHPRKSRKNAEGEQSVPVTFAGATFRPGDHVYADEDGIVVLPREIA